jgi:hypothetical protein
MRQTLIAVAALLTFTTTFSQNKNAFDTFYINHLKTGVEKKKAIC